MPVEEETDAGRRGAMLETSDEVSERGCGRDEKRWLRG